MKRGRFTGKNGFDVVLRISAIVLSPTLHVTDRTDADPVISFIRPVFFVVPGAIARFSKVRDLVMLEPGRGEPGEQLAHRAPRVCVRVSVRAS